MTAERSVSAQWIRPTTGVALGAPVLLDVIDWGTGLFAESRDEFA
ncbi:hypothetical protein ABIA39_005281 [Nocardia sp. GAS34]